MHHLQYGISPKLEDTRAIESFLLPFGVKLSVPVLPTVRPVSRNYPRYTGKKPSV